MQAVRCKITSVPEKKIAHLLMYTVVSVLLFFQTDVKIGHGVNGVVRAWKPNNRNDIRDHHLRKGPATRCKQS